MEALSNVTHIIIDDCQEHNPYSDITMFEIKDVLIFMPHLKVILLTTPDFSLPLKKYFCEGNILIFPGNIENIQRIHLEDILETYNIDIDILVPRAMNKGIKVEAPPDKDVQINMDKLLDDYLLTGSDENFNIFIYILECHEISVDIQHSVKKITASMCAAYNNRLDHLKVLMKEKKANAWIFDVNYKTAAAYANSRKFFECSQYINECLREKELLELETTYKACYYQDYRDKAEGMHIDFKLISELVKWIFKTYSKLERNIVVVYLPDYEHIIRQHYHLLVERIVGGIPHDIEIFLVHDDIQKDQLVKLKSGESKIII